MTDLDVAPPRCHSPSVEKRKPHHDLAAFQRAFSTEKALYMTLTAATDDRVTAFRLLSFKER
jgi:hypothetical protein